jgi:hypothetical protein
MAPLENPSVQAATYNSLVANSPSARHLHLGQCSAKVASPAYGLKADGRPFLRFR